MNVKSVKQTFGLAAAAVGASGAMMLAPTVANAATAHPAHVQAVSNVSHVQAVSNVSRTSGGWGGGLGGWGGGLGGWGGGLGGWGGWWPHCTTVIIIIHRRCCWGGFW
jgi:hypothetical protein